MFRTQFIFFSTNLITSKFVLILTKVVTSSQTIYLSRLKTKNSNTISVKNVGTWCVKCGRQY